MLEGIFDTSLVSHAAQGVPEALERMNAVILGRTEAGISSMTAYELWLTKPLTREVEGKYQLFLSFLVELPIDHEIAVATANALRSESRQRRARLFHDAVIAHTAMKYGIPIHTGDRKFISYGARIEHYEVR